MSEHSAQLCWENLDREELTTEELEDLAIATEARKNAHAPYSNFMVGASIRTNNNNIFPGWNVENIVYEATHAEQNAIGRITIASRESGLKRATIVGGLIGQESSDAVSPCGQCRQELLELVGPEDHPKIIMAGTKGKIIKVGLRDILPFAFFPGLLKKDK